jgi:Icc-related predicted phosphoesterase
MDILKYLSKFAPVYTIEGNVTIFTDFEAKKDSKKWKTKFPSTIKEIKKLGNVHLVKNRLRVLNGIKIGFLEYFIDTCWMREFKPSNYRKRMKKAKKETDKARRVLKRFKNIDILICHQPPYGILDKVTWKEAPKHYQGKHAGSKVILDYIKKKQPKYVFCGHIHEEKGMRKIGKTEIYNLGVAGHKIIKVKK